MSIQFIKPLFNLLRRWHYKQISDQDRESASPAPSKGDPYCVNYLLLFYFLLLLFVYCDELLRFFRFMFLYSLAPEKLITLIAGVMVIVFSMIGRRLNVKAIPAEVNILDGIVLLIIIVYFCLYLPFPDWSFDTQNYHQYLQVQSFTDPVQKNYFPVYQYSTFFSLADRIYYFSRLFFGYRLGTIINLYILVLIYFQVKEIIIILIEKYHLVNVGNVLTTTAYHILIQIISSIFAFLTISSEFLFANLSIYKVDIVALPLFLEVLRLIIKPKSSGKLELYISALLCGFAISIKLTSLLPAFTLIVMFITTHRQYFKLKTILTMILSLFLPVSIYLIFNFSSTGNPIYPYYNEIFKSPFYPAVNYKDVRFGPKNLAELIYWPVIAFLNSERISELGQYSGRLALGYGLLLLVAPLTLLKNNKFHTLIPLACLSLGNIFLWAMTTGYIRYALIIELFIGIFLAQFILLLLKDYHIQPYNIIAFIVTVTFIIQAVYAHTIFFVLRLDWGQRTGLMPALVNTIVFGNKRAMDSYKENYLDNLSYVFHDRPPYLSGNESSLLNGIGAWLTPHMSAGYSVLLRDNIPLISGDDTIVGNGPGLERIKLLESHENVYAVIDLPHIDYVIESMNRSGFTFSRITYIFPSFNNHDDPLLLFKLKKSNLGNSIYMLTANQDFDLPFSTNGNISKLEFFIAAHPAYIREGGDDLRLTISLSNDKDEKILFEERINPRIFQKITVHLPESLKMPNKGQNLCFRFRISGIRESKTSDRAILINPRLR